MKKTTLVLILLAGLFNVPTFAKTTKKPPSCNISNADSGGNIIYDVNCEPGESFKCPTPSLGPTCSTLCSKTTGLNKLVTYVFQKDITLNKHTQIISVNYQLFCKSTKGNLAVYHYFTYDNGYCSCPKLKSS